MKSILAALIFALLGSTLALNSFETNRRRLAPPPDGNTMFQADIEGRSSYYQQTYNNNRGINLWDLPGALPPMGAWDPLGFSRNCNIPTMKRYREAEVVHGRVAMLATIGFLAGEYVVDHHLFHTTIKGPAISHMAQVPNGFWIMLVIAIGAAEQTRATIGWVEPEYLPPDQPGMLRPNYVPGDLGFDPLNLKPYYLPELWDMQTKELQHGRLAMIAIAGMVAQELVNHKGIVENWHLMFGGK